MSSTDVDCSKCRSVLGNRQKHRRYETLSNKNDLEHNHSRQKFHNALKYTFITLPITQCESDVWENQKLLAGMQA